MVKRGITAATIFIFCLMLSGCVDAMPDMTDEENDLVAEYAATILLKHSNNYKYRLVDDEILERALFEENQALQAAIDELEKNEEDSMQDSTEDLEGQENFTENADETLDSSNEDTVTVETKKINYLSEENLAVYLGLEDKFSIRYTGKEVTTNYPKELSDSGFQLSAAKDNSLLVLHFDLLNITSEKIYCDMMDVNPSIKLNVNDHGYAKVENTLLINDFTTFMSDVKAGENVELVTVLEIPDEDIEEIMFQILWGKAKQELYVD